MAWWKVSEAKIINPRWRASYSAQRLSEFVQRCHERHVSVTPQRLAIIRALMASENHPSAEEICSIVRRQHPHVSLATVHRILEQFCQVGEARKVTPLHGSARYDGHIEPHHHVVCVNCRRIQDLELPEADRILPGRANLGEFEVLSFSVEIEGLCRQCRTRTAGLNRRTRLQH